MPRRPAASDDTAEDRKSARQRVLDTAMEMFYREGVRAVGVDAVVARAGVCKMSLYRAFPSKDDLVVAFLEEASRRYWQWWDKVAARADGPRGKLREIFAALAHRTSSPGWRGCPFVNTAAEFADPEHPGRAVVLTHRRELRRRLRALCAEAGAARPDLLGDQLLLLMEGAYAAGSVMPGESPSPAVAEAAERLVESQTA